MWKYSIHSYTKKINIIYFNSLDSKCKASAILKFYKENKNIYSGITEKNFTKSHKYNISNKYHSY